MAALAEKGETQSIGSAAGSDTMKMQLIHPNDCLKRLRVFVEEARQHVYVYKPMFYRHWSDSIRRFTYTRTVVTKYSIQLVKYKRSVVQSVVVCSNSVVLLPKTRFAQGNCGETDTV